MRKSIPPFTPIDTWTAKPVPKMGYFDSFFIGGMEKGARERVAHYIYASAKNWGRADKENSIRVYQQVLKQGIEMSEQLAARRGGRPFTLKLAWIIEVNPTFGNGQEIGGDGYNYWGRQVLIGQPFKTTQSNMFAS